MKKAILYLDNGTRTPIEIIDDHLERLETWREFERRIMKRLKQAQPNMEHKIVGIRIFRN